MGTVSITRRAGIPAALVCLFTLSLTACGTGAEPDATSTVTVSPTATATASPTPASTAAVDASDGSNGDADLDDDAGPITSATDGTPVTPDIFMLNVDRDEGVLTVVVYVPGVYEDGGRCTVTVESRRTERTQENVGTADVSSTACGMFTFSLAELPSGTASVTAHYESSGHAGASDVAEVQIP